MRKLPPDVFLSAQRPLRAPRPGRARISMQASAHSLGRVDEPARLAVLDLRDDATDAAGDRRAASSRAPPVTVSPKPSRIDFWITAAECTWNAFTSTEPTLFRFERM